MAQCSIKYVSDWKVLEEPTISLGVRSHPFPCCSDPTSTEIDEVGSALLRLNSTTIRARVQEARHRQLQRFSGTKMTSNAEIGPTEVREICQTDTSSEKLLKAAVQQLHLSARAYHRVLKLARTIADLAGNEEIMANHVAEAAQYRPRVGM